VGALFAADDEICDEYDLFRPPYWYTGRIGSFLYR